jgi:hypothetical protein
MRLPSSCALIAGAVSIPRPPALLDAGQFFSAHVLVRGQIFESRFSKKISTANNFQKLPTAIYFYFS